MSPLDLTPRPALSEGLIKRSSAVGEIKPCRQWKCLNCDVSILPKSDGFWQDGDLMAFSFGLCSQ